MVGRFVDNEDFVKEAKTFTRRDHGTPIWWIIIAFITAFSFILISLAFLTPHSIITTAISITAILISLLAVVSHFILKDKGTITTIELQNAIFSEVAKITADLCMILKYDGSILYMTPEYFRKLLKGKVTGIADLDLLLEKQIINQSEKDNLLSAISSSRKNSVHLDSPVLSDNGKQSTFIIEPIFIHQRQDSGKKLILSAKQASRPSGYFLLRKQRKDTVSSKTDVNKLAMGIYAINNKNEFTKADSIFENILGYETGEILAGGLKFDDLFFDKEAAKNIISGGSPLPLVATMCGKDNAKKCVFISHIENADKTSGGFGVVANITNRLALNGESSEGDKMPDLVDSSPIATAILNLDGRVLRSNKPFRAIAEQLAPKEKKWNLLDIITEDLKSSVRTVIANVASGKIDGSKAVDIKINGENDSTASLYISRVIDEYGKVDNLIAHLIDTTELKNLELRFVHSQKMQAVGQLAGGIAHDFNNLLTAMMGFCDLLLMRHPAGDQSFADIMQIKQNANRAANLVRQLLAFSRKQTLQPEIIFISDVLADLSNLIGRLIGENIELKMLHGRDLGNVKVDQGQLEQVIINLAVNARDAMSEGGTLTIKTSNYTVDGKRKLSRNLIPPVEDELIEEGEYVLIEVVDSGCGMEREEIGKIFEPFYSTKEIGAGTGLGLSTVYGIIKQTDGYVYVSSRVGKGSKFSIFLKRYESAENSTYVRKEDSHAEKASLSDLTGKGTVLLVEDETPVRIFSNSALISKGYKVLEADCAEAALKIVSERGDELDVIITDVVMPGLSGPDMIKKVYEQYPDVKVIFMSGYGEDAFLESFGSERKFNFLAKPYTLKQLATKVKEVLTETGK